MKSLNFANWCNGEVSKNAVFTSFYIMQKLVKTGKNTEINK